MTDNRYFIKTPHEACLKGEVGSPLYGNCSICSERENCQKNNRISIESDQYVQTWLKSCVEEKNLYAKYISYNEKEHRFECDWEMVELEDKAIYEPEKLTDFEKIRLKNARQKQTGESGIKKFFEKVADAFDKIF